MRPSPLYGVLCAPLPVPTVGKSANRLLRFVPAPMLASMAMDAYYDAPALLVLGNLAELTQNGDLCPFWDPFCDPGPHEHKWS